MTRDTYHIMLVEDSSSQATKVMSILQAEGWEVTWASNAEKAFATLSTMRPDLLLLDYYLPGMRGDEVCRRIRMNIDSRSMPIVMLTSEENHELQGLESGADDFIVKSAESDLLILKLRTLLQRTRTEDRILSGTRASLRQTRVLAIDDNRAFLERIHAEFEIEGYLVETAINPEEGLERALHGSFDAVVIDLVMPKMDGIELCRRLNQERAHLETPLVTVILTGMESRENLTKALEAGADDFVGKSEDFSVLKGRIRALLRRKFFTEENARIVHELRERELEALRERAAKEAAQTRAALVEQLEEKTHELNRSRDELRQANQAKDHFLAILSHELRTPLTPILAVVSQHCESPSVPAALRKDLAMIKRNIELEARLIDDLLDLTRIVQGKLEVQSENVDLENVVRHVVETNLSSENAATISTEFLALNTRIRGDSSRLTQVIWNLLRNAIKFTPADGHITVRLWNEKDQIVFEITDTGIGIEPEKLATIFEAFEQGSRQVTRKFGGLGLGLAISKAIVLRHAGTITARSEGKDKGTSFQVRLPNAAAATAGSIVLPRTTPPPSPQKIRPEEKKALHILLVEDHPDTRDIMERLLSAQGYKITLAQGVASAAKAAAESGPFDILISDLGLEDGSGFDVIAEVSKHQSIPAIALSGYGMEADIQKSLAAGFSHHLVKPVDFGKLDEAIASLSHNPKASAPVPKFHSILLVEDDADTSDAVKQILTNAGYEVQTAATIAEGIQKTLQNKFDLIISDIGLPDGHGIGLLTSVRQFCQAPAIALTAHGSPQDIERCLKAGFDLHLTKPIDKASLEKAIAQIAQSPAASRR